MKTQALPGVLDGNTQSRSASVVLVPAADRESAQRVPPARCGAQAGQAAGPRPRAPAHHLRAHARTRPRALPGQAQRPARHGGPVRTAAQLHRRTGRRQASRRAVAGLPRRPGGDTDVAARAAGHRQDPLRAQAGRAAGHRHEPGAHELDDGRLAAVGRVVAVEGRQARQGVRSAGGRPVRQPGDRGRRDRQGQRRRPVRSRSAPCTACWNTTRPARSWTNSPRWRSTPAR